ncbi:S8 family serine peptidase [Sanguibacter gelidistatuariae]|uniref:S8 family serine peptidase n=1 Tax=Sanguibacter gelidistatuariae TaxID=1814289 RepID=UPI000B1A07B8|nr:S8 family serine peptidase [Sanguibacter gelidistatuariae]
MIVSGLPMLSLRPADRERFVTRRSARTPKAPERDRSQHGASLLDQIDRLAEQFAAIRAEPGSSSIVTARGAHLDDYTVSRQLAPANSGSELLVSDEGRVVFRVSDDLAGLRAKAVAYTEEDTPKGNPRFGDLVARIDQIAMATIADLSLGEIPDDTADEDRLWVEIWTRGGARLSPAEHQGIDAAVAAFAALTTDSFDVIPVFHGPERDVRVVLASGASLKALPVLLPDAAEVHLAPAVFPIVLAESRDDAGELARVDLPPENAIVVAVHDSGVDSSHPYVNPILLGAASVVPGVLGATDTDGHGTQMAGVAAYSALADGVAGGYLHADAWLIAMRLLESSADAGGDPERGVMWAERTAESVEVAESLAGDRPVVHNLSIGADNPAIGRTDRTAWSVSADVLAWNGGQGRVLVVAGGNADTITDPADYPYINLGPSYLQQPGQAWNVLTVGGYSALGALTVEDTSMGYPAPLARPGQLSPHSRTAAVANSPIKPDIVMEAGNTGPGGGLENPEAQGLSILTLRSTAGGSASLLRRTYKTSPAAAAASNALAQIAAAHPDLAPATWRALLVHTARWPEAAVAQFPDRRDLLRSFGYGVPRTELAMASDSNRPVMIYEGSLRPSRRIRSKPDRQADFIEIPFPEDELHAIGDSIVELTVTLSYFAEPTDNLTRRAYVGGRLRWDLQGPSETGDGFRARINRVVHEQGVTPGAGSYPWVIPADDRSRGTLQHDHTTVPAANIAGTRLLAVYPVLGWWEDAREGWEKDLPYSVVVSVDLGEVELDIHTLVAAALLPISVPVRHSP